jgi:hypothetical protein
MSQSKSVLMTAFPVLCYYAVSVCLLRVYSIFTPFVVQDERTVLMITAIYGASIETMHLLLDSGAAPSINNKDKKVALLCSHPAV